MKQFKIYMWSILLMTSLFFVPVYAAPGSSSNPSESIDQNKREDIKKLLILMNSKELGKQVMLQMINQFKKMQPNIPNQFWDQFVNAKSMDSLIEITVPIYAKHLSHDDIKGLIKFYQTPLGKKFITKMPMITQESMQAGQQWGQQLAMKIMQALKKQGILNKK